MYGPNEVTHVAPEHFAAFGRVCHAFARVESIYEAAILTSLELLPYQAAMTLSQYGYEPKRQLLFAIIEETDAPDALQKKFKSLIESIGKKSALRNNVAHCVWRKGSRDGAIKPYVIKTKSRLLLLGGDDDTERDWTAQELHAEADEILERASAFKAFLVDHGLFPAGNFHGLYE